jgi:hypothetical protein
MPQPTEINKFIFGQPLSSSATRPGLSDVLTSPFLA